MLSYGNHELSLFFQSLSYNSSSLRLSFMKTTSYICKDPSFSYPLDALSLHFLLPWMVILFSLLLSLAPIRLHHHSSIYTITHFIPDLCTLLLISYNLSLGYITGHYRYHFSGYKISFLRERTGRTRTSLEMNVLSLSSSIIAILTSLLSLSNLLIILRYRFSLLLFLTEFIRLQKREALIQKCRKKKMKDRWLQINTNPSVSYQASASVRYRKQEEPQAGTK